MNEELLRNYAKLIVRVGVNVKENQPVIVYANVKDEYFVKLVVEEAYLAKAKKVTVEWSSDELDIVTYKHCDTDVLKEYPDWKIEKLKYQKETLPATIYIESSDPDYLKDADQNKIMDVKQTIGKIVKPIRDEFDNYYQWTIVAIPSLTWAKHVFPDLDNEQAMASLWDAIFKCTRVYGDPIANWNKHNDTIHSNCDRLNSMNIKTLHYHASNGTNFSVGLKENVKFSGAGSYTIQGYYYNPNMPTEECFTSPDKDTMEGIVYASKPLSLQGKLLKNFGFKFEKGKVTEVIAEDPEHKEILEKLVNMDEGARMLGEVSLVPFNSPINETGIIFYNTLFDENACCHVALGAGFEDCIDGYESMTKEERKAVGLNDSIIHVDFMIGTADLSITADTRDGKSIQIFKDGTWAI